MAKENYTPTPGSLSEPEKKKQVPYWQAAIESGMGRGRELFYDDPDMQMLRQRRMDLSQGYSGQEMGALREGARREIAGQRQGYMGQLRSNLARQGVGGARSAAVQSAGNQRFAQAQADAERKMALDSAQLRRQGVSDLQDYLFRQKFGQLGTGLGYGQIAAAENTGSAMRQAGQASGPGGLMNTGLSVTPFTPVSPFGILPSNVANEMADRLGFRFW